MTATVTDADLDQLYADFETAGLMPLWTQREDLMPVTPKSNAVPHAWHWKDLLPLAERAGALVPVGRGGERRAIALANPGLKGVPHATPTLWAAIQYLGPNEVAPDHRHAQNAFRFVVEGEGVWTVVNHDPVAMSRGDLLLTPGWHWHGHHNSTDKPMAWIDGLDIPLLTYLDAEFFEPGADDVVDRSMPRRSRSERLWAHPGLRPLSALVDQPNSPLMAYRWEFTDAALAAQLELEVEGFPGVAGPGHAAVRFSNPTTGDDALVTMRTEMHRFRSGATWAPDREVASSVWQVFTGSATITLNGQDFELGHGDLLAVPSFTAVQLTAHEDVDLFRFSDAPVIEKLNLHQTRLQSIG
jgi:gentisate 1,2-dioxygenase